MTDVFISYCREDEVNLKRLLQTLSATAGRCVTPAGAIKRLNLGKSGAMSWKPPWSVPGLES